jgi:hypothetical protein
MEGKKSHYDYIPNAGIGKWLEWTAYAPPGMSV